MQIFIGEEGRFADALPVDEAKATMERRRRRTGFLEQVGIDPVAHRLGVLFRPFQLVEDEGGAQIGVVNGVTRIIAGAPFRNVERQTRLG